MLLHNSIHYAVRYIGELYTTGKTKTVVAIVVQKLLRTRMRFIYGNLRVGTAVIKRRVYV